jgi:transposase
LFLSVADALHLVALYYQEEFEPYRQKSIQLSELQFLTRQHEAMTEMYVQMKLKFQATLDQVFPAYVGVFGDLYSKTSLKFLQENPTPTKVLQIGVDGIAEFIQCMNKRSKSSTWVVEKAKK